MNSSPPNASRSSRQSARLWSSECRLRPKRTAPPIRRFRKNDRSASLGEVAPSVAQRSEPTSACTTLPASARRASRTRRHESAEIDRGVCELSGSDGRAGLDEPAGGGEVPEAVDTERGPELARG